LAYGFASSTPACTGDQTSQPALRASALTGAVGVHHERPKIADVNTSIVYEHLRNFTTQPFGRTRGPTKNSLTLAVIHASAPGTGHLGRS
jgi:hypothetical protein